MSVGEMTDETLPSEFKGFFDNVAAGRVAFPKCTGCGKFHWYPMPRCPHCRSSAIAWAPVEGRAEIYSFTEVRHAFDKSRKGKLPYIVAIVTFADAPGVRLVTNIVGVELAAISIGQAVAPVFGTDEAGRPLVQFRPA